MAHKWPKAHKQEASAVIVFEVPNGKISNLCGRTHDGIFTSGEGKEFLDDNDEWKKLVTYFRRGPEGYTEEQTTTYDDLKYVFGPIVIQPRTLRAMTPHKFQLCINDKGLAKRFFDKGRNIVKVIFFHDD